MKKLLFLTLSIAITFMVNGQTKIMLSAGSRSVVATAAENEAAGALIALLCEGPITVTMTDYGGFEKVGPLPCPLPSSDTRITTVPGDIMLYQGRNIVIFYGPNTWAYTPLGKIDDVTASAIRDFLGTGSVSVTLSLISNGVEQIPYPISTIDTVYDLNGRIVESRPIPPGYYILNGRKILIN